ncbi:MAG: helix-turn-helix domain-containing protein [Spirochaetaceae bacterium]|jgi:AraC-like DNA-binding protein|nr:helix-turn-helix domain-containing protein [Spirochaetaceae bacterium]
MWRNPSPASIIGRREIEPLLFRTYEVLKSYEEATGTVAALLDQSGRFDGTNNCTLNFKFCTFCKAHSCKSMKDGKSGCPHTSQAAPQSGCSPLTGDSGCTKQHLVAGYRARSAGGTYIYMCSMGFVFWTAPILVRGHALGALVAGGVLGISPEQAVEKLHGLCPDSPESREEEKFLLGLKGKSGEEIKALARLLVISAEQLSRIQNAGPERPGQANNAMGRLRLVRDREKPADTAWPLDRERTLLAALRRGDGDAWRKALDDLIEYIQYSSGNAPLQGSLESMRNRVMELAVLLSRAALFPRKTGGEPYDEFFGTFLTGLPQGGPQAEAASPETLPAPPPQAETPSAKTPPPKGRAPDAAPEGTDMEGSILESNNRWFKRIQEAKSPEELAAIVRLIAERLSFRIFSFRGMRHASALRKAERFIWDNYTRKISLREIAQASGLSGPYFSSVFKEEMGENLSNYLNRLRVERAMTMLTESEQSISAIAGACGFEDQSWFSKIFKSFTGVTPGKYREQGQAGFSAPKSGAWTVKPWDDTPDPFQGDNRGGENSKETG